MNTIDLILEKLLAYIGEDDTFNQYRQNHPEHDLPDGAAVRCRNLRQFLATFTDVRYILLAEAAGYQGCRFTGIPMTAEVNVLGSDPVHWIQGGDYARSGRRERLWREPSATILWETLGHRMDCLIWNTFPWHPMGKRGPLSNRTPRRTETQAGLVVLDALMQRYPAARPVAIGRIAERRLTELGFDPVYVRHPAHGGKPEFVQGIDSLT